MTRSTLRIVLDAVAAVSMTAASAVLIWTILHPPAQTGFGRPQPTQPSPSRETPAPTEPISLEGAHLLGNKSAPFALVAYSDFECPFCAKAATQTLPEFFKRYVDTGRVLVAFRHLPLDRHLFALKAAEAAECAGRQGKFWQMHDALFANQRDLGHAALVKRATALGLEVSQFRACMKGDTTPKIQDDRSRAEALQVRATPTFMLGRLQPDGRVNVSRVITGAVSLELLDAAISTLEAPPRATR